MEGVKRNTLFVGAGQFLRIVMAFILLPVASRILGDESFGRYNLATTLMFFVMLMDDLGLNMWVTREIAKYRDRSARYLSYTIGLKTVLIGASLLFVLVVGHVFPYDAQTIRSIWIFSLYGLLISFRDLAVAIFRAYEDMKWETLVLSLERVLITATGVLALVLGFGLEGLAWAFVLSAVISLSVSGIIIVRRFVPIGFAVSAKEFWPMIRGASVFGISIFLTTMYSRIDMLMLSVLKSPDVWGWYAAAHKLIDFTNVVPNVVMIATFPTLARYSLNREKRMDELFARGLKYLLILAVPLVPSIFMLSRPIILLINGPEFVYAIPALRVFSFTAAILFLNIFAAGLFGATNNQGKLVLIQIIGLSMNAGLNYLLIPDYAHVGAAYATVMTETVVLAITMAYVLKNIITLPNFRFFYQIALAGAAMVVVLITTRNASVYFALISAFAVYCATLLALKTITFREIVGLKRGQG